MVGLTSPQFHSSESPSATAYLLYASDNNQNFKISRLDADYYNVSAQVNVISGGCSIYRV